MMFYRKFLTLFLLPALITSLLGGCNNQSSTSNSKQLTTITATMQPTSTNLYYNSTMLPISVENIVSPADGNITKINFKYGAYVKSGTTLITINASKLQEDFMSAVTSFLTAKDKLTSSQNSYKSNQALYQNKVISQDEFNAAIDTLENDELSMLQAVYKLKQTLETIPGFNVNIENLSLKDMSAVKELLTKNYSIINLSSKTSGIALLPPSSSSSSSSSSSEDKTLQVGSEVKQGQVLLSIGNLSGLMLKVSITEMNINQIKVGQPVTVTSSALPGITLQGSVSMVGSQAQSSSSGGSQLATFPVEIQVPKLTSQQQQLIRVGMSAKVQISIPGPSAIVIPIAAVSMQNGQTVVQVQSSTGQIQTVPVTTGTTTPTGVIITSGLKAGDKVVVSDQSSSSNSDSD